MEEKIQFLEITIKQMKESDKKKELLFEKILNDTFVTPELRDVYREKWNEL